MIHVINDSCSINRTFFRRLFKVKLCLRDNISIVIFCEDRIIICGGLITNFVSLHLVLIGCSYAIILASMSFKACFSHL